jgi:hypothetical protein
MRNIADAYINHSVYSGVKHDTREPKSKHLIDKFRDTGADAVLILAAKFCENRRCSITHSINAHSRKRAFRIYASSSRKRCGSSIRRVRRSRLSSNQCSSIRRTLWRKQP